MNFKELHQFSHQLYQCSTLDDLLTTALQVAERHLRIDEGCFVLIGLDGKLKFYTLSEQPLSRAAMVSRIAEDKRLLLTGFTDDHSLICIPLTIEGHLEGVFYLKNHPDSVDAAKWLTEFVALLIQLQTAKTQIEHDQLTLKEVYSFLRMAAHKLKASLTVIQTSLSVITRLAGTSSFGRHILHAKQGVYNIVKLVDTSLDFVKLTALPGVSLEMVKLEYVISEVLETLKEHANRQQITFTFLPSPIELNIYGDENELSQLIAELLKNTLQFSHVEKQVVIRLFRVKSNAILEIIDQGIGIPAEHLPLIFNPLFATTDLQSNQGNGLGLSIVKRIADRHGAKIEVQSDMEQGSVFRVIFPL